MRDDLMLPDYAYPMRQETPRSSKAWRWTGVGVVMTVKAAGPWSQQQRDGQEPVRELRAGAPVTVPMAGFVPDGRWGPRVLAAFSQPTGTSMLAPRRRRIDSAADGKSQFTEPIARCTRR
jgi:hypothetical protein